MQDRLAREMRSVDNEAQGTLWIAKTQTCVCVCVLQGIGHFNVLGLNPLTLPAVQSEENLAADGILGRHRLASAMRVCRAAVHRQRCRHEGAVRQSPS